MTVDSQIKRDCVIAGGGPGGMVLGYLLARQGLRVTVLEKHGDFLRDFRGDTVHPSTVTLLGELGLRGKFLELPLSKLSTLDIVIDGQRITTADFSTLPAPDNFLVLAPQWDFLNFLAREAHAFPNFELRMLTEATGLIIEEGQVRGVRALASDGGLEIRATLTVAADGRESALRHAAGLIPDDFGVPIDVLWFNLPKPPDPPSPTLGYISAQGLVLTIDRGDRYQSGMVIRKGGFDELRGAKIDVLQARITGAAPILRPVVGNLTDWDQVKLLSVQINRLRRWYRPGFMAIGDAAHAMSPMFGVGVNFAIQDAVALANAIGEDLAGGTAPVGKLAAVQRRREMPVKIMQQLQRNGHRVLLRATNGNRIAPRWFVMFLRAASPLLRRITARFVGIGIRPEHVKHRGA
ncbi:2-polyprenyl-6-methoxyphenol hydroxylase-like FAD-dependent oxidoreductase [Pseudarthrobacter sp. W1I19]|uniref:FAD-dependent oxidoreductase n=1 Tax=Pseudarthrobacter sp. W1I19 TaxID=3042288 RepID=UPI0027846F32|nr:FAD-dependent oxidoreductase [Pseudarthrobacter sp. W1I19]MDQ0922204.1 2-polyprenyl-6-methoxyphenol hydroxylase-like FAD-dependent oxidoreductase [Pseudarthrobacter sp. W1I19]